MQIDSNTTQQAAKSQDLAVIDWGEIEYQDALEKQQLWIDEISQGKRQQTLVFCNHPPVVTLGRATGSKDIESWSGPTLETNRGGRATYHGHNQQVIYPLLDLSLEHKGFRSKDLKSYLRFLEQLTIQVLAQLGVEGRVREDELFDEEGEKLETTGVWVGDQKIASMGIAVRKWISYHGIAVNLYEDANAFQGIRPCGFAPSVMTSLQAQTGKSLTRSEFQKTFVENL